MIFTLIENFVLFSVVFALIAYGTASLIRLGIRNEWWLITPFTLTRIYAGLILFPPVFALWLVLAALLPVTWLGTEIFRTVHFAPVHERHLLSELTEKFEPFLAYATILFLLIVSFFLVWKSLRSYFRIGGIIRFLEIEAPTPDPAKVVLVESIANHYGLKVGLVLSKKPLTFVWGIWQSKIVLSSGLLNELNIAELQGVVEHEAAHHTRRDNLVKLILSASCHLSLAFPLTRRILRWQAEQIELVCDEIAAVNTRKPLEIASALVKVRRRFPALHANPAVASSFMTEETPSIECRVKRLIELADALPANEFKTKLNQMPLFETVWVTLFFFSSLAIVVFLAPLGVHETAETLIRIIK